jgi:hypothetical protein
MSRHLKTGDATHVPYFMLVCEIQLLARCNTLLGIFGGWSRLCRSPLGGLYVPVCVCANPYLAWVCYAGLAGTPRRFYRIPRGD